MAKRLIPDCYAGIESDDTAANRTDVSRKRVGTFDPSLIEDPTEFRFFFTPDFTRVRTN